MPWWYDVVEARHELQNPTSPEKIRLLGERLGLGPSSHVLDIGSGKGGPAVLLAREIGCRITSVERSPEFAAVARERVREAGVEVEVVESDAKDFRIEPVYDAALCLGASFAFDGLVPTVEALANAVPSRGFVAVGEPYWRTWPLPADFEVEEGEDFLTLPQTVERFESAGVQVVTLIASSHDDWDRYESLHWLALEEWLAANPDDPQAEEFRERGCHHRDRYLRWIRDLMGWAIFICRT
ncbi:MAG: methyltransferase domain-containing protein [Actinobacteria bacterium]|nr:methyltransferase domain-containing protein [Actinomycetota bacterium]